MMRTRKLWVLLLAVVCLLALSATAFAKVDFLNQVDESDLAALVGDSGTAAPPVCSCGEKRCQYDRVRRKGNRAHAGACHQA